MPKSHDSILIICQHFIPYAPSLGRVIRMITLADFLKKQGFKVFILTSKGVNFGYFGYEKILNSLSIKYINDPLKVRLQKKQAKKFSGKNINKKNTYTSFISKIIKSLIENLAIPDLGVFMVREYTQIACEVINRENISNVIVSSPPHSLQLVGVKLKQRYKNKITLISEYRDSWNVTPSFSKKFFLSRLISEKMEKSVLLSCDNFIYVSPPMLKKLQEKYPINLTQKSYLIMNGFIKEYNANSPQFQLKNRSSLIRIGYFGQASDHRDDAHSILNLLKVLEEAKTNWGNLLFEFYGAVELSTERAENSLPLHIHQRIPHADALKRMAEMDLLLFVYSNPKCSDEVISGKLFEYISVRRPILCLGPKNLEARRIVEKYGIGITIDIEDPIDIEKKLEHLPDYLNQDFYKDLDISLFKRENQYQKFLELLR